MSNLTHFSLSVDKSTSARNLPSLIGILQYCCLSENQYTIVIMYLQHIILVFAALISLSISVQYCHNNANEPSKFCLAVNICHNDTSQSDDFYFSLATSFESKQGWLGVGTGFSMDSSLMFAIYPGTGDDGKSFQYPDTADTILI